MALDSPTSSVAAIKAWYFGSRALSTLIQPGNDSPISTDISGVMSTLPYNS